MARSPPVHDQERANEATKTTVTPPLTETSPLLGTARGSFGPKAYETAEKKQADARVPSLTTENAVQHQYNQHPIIGSSATTVDITEDEADDEELARSNLQTNEKCQWGCCGELLEEKDEIERSGRSVRSRHGSSDAVTYDTMMQLSLPRNPFRHERFRSFVIWLMTSCILFTTNQLTTLPVGFFPTYAQKQLGMTPFHLSLFFSIYPLCIMVSSPLAASKSRIIGRQTFICLGLVVSGSTTIAFAYTTSIAMVFILRILQGLGAGAAVVGAFSMITEEFSASIGQVLVIQEFVVAAAFITAPPLGSALYEYQGFQMPFLTVGVAQLIIVMIVPFLFIEYSLPDGLYSTGPIPSTYACFSDPIGFRDVLTPTCILCLSLTVFAMASFGFIDPYLGSHMQTVLGAQHIAIGSGFAVSALVYFLGGVLYMWLSRKCGCKHVILFGVLLLALGFFFLGPPPFLDAYFASNERLWTTQWLALVCIGCGAALSIAPGLPLTLMSVSCSGGGTQAFNLVIGLFSAAIYLGQALGPFIALLLMQLLPSTPARNCLELGTHETCESSLPWAFTVYSFAAMALLVLVTCKLSTGDQIIAFLASKRHLSLSRQTSEYGQFIFLEDGEDDDDEAGSY